MQRPRLLTLWGESQDAEARADDRVKDWRAARQAAVREERARLRARREQDARRLAALRARLRPGQRRLLVERHLDTRHRVRST
jgi:hypothetical protein